MENIIISLNEMSERLISFMGSMLLQSSILIAAIAILDFFLKSKVKAVIRYGLWMLILLKLVIPPDFSLPTGIGYWMPKDTIAPTVAVINDYSTPVVYSSESSLTDLPAYSHSPIEYHYSNTIAATSEPTIIEPDINHPTKTTAPLKWQSIIAIAWLSLFILGITLTCIRYWYVKNIISTSSIADPDLTRLMKKYKHQLKIKRKINIRITSGSHSPSVCGIFKPIILFPKNLIDKLTTVQLKAILMHELIHVKRHDLLVNTFQTILQLIYFFHPLLWFANAHIRKIREQVVDETVMIAMGSEAEHYPTTLLEMSRRIIMKPSLHINMLEVAESKSSLISRIKRIASVPLPKNARLGTLGLTCIIITAATLLPMAANSDTANANNIETVPASVESPKPHPEINSAELTRPEAKIPDDELVQVESNLPPANYGKPAPEPHPFRAAAMATVNTTPTAQSSTGYNLTETAEYTTRHFVRLVINPDSSMLIFEGNFIKDSLKGLTQLDELLANIENKKQTILEIAINSNDNHYFSREYDFYKDPTYKSLCDRLHRHHFEYLSFIGKQPDDSFGTPTEYHYKNIYLNNVDYDLKDTTPQKNIICKSIKFDNSDNELMANLAYRISNHAPQYLINLKLYSADEPADKIAETEVIINPDRPSIGSMGGGYGGIQHDASEQTIQLILPKCNPTSFDISIRKVKAESRFADNPARTSGLAMSVSNTNPFGIAMGGGGMMGGMAIPDPVPARSIPPISDMIVPRTPDVRELFNTIEQRNIQKELDPIMVEIDKKILETELTLLEAQRTKDEASLSMLDEKLHFLHEQKEQRSQLLEAKEQELNEKIKVQEIELQEKIARQAEAMKQIQEKAKTFNEMNINKRLPISHNYQETCRILNETKFIADFSDVALAEAIDFIADRVNVNVLTFWNALDLAGVTRDDLVSLNFTKEVSAGKALELVLKYVTKDVNAPIGYTIDEEGNVFINVVDKDHDYTFRTYYIGDLVRPMYNFNQNQYGSNNNNTRNGTGLGGSNNRGSTTRSSSSQGGMSGGRGR